PHLARDHLAAVQMRGRRGPAGLGEGGPSRALALDEVRAALGAERDRRLPVALQAEAHPVLLGPGPAGADESLLDQLGEGEAVVLAHLLGAGRVDLQQVQHGQQVVAAPLPELLRQRGGPARVVHLEAVAEHGAEQVRGTALSRAPATPSRWGRTAAVPPGAAGRTAAAAGTARAARGPARRRTPRGCR